MQYCRMIAPDWLLEQQPKTRRVLEGMFTSDQIKAKNSTGYNVYYLPNHPKEYDLSAPVNGSQVDVFNVTFVDYDLKSGNRTKDEFIEEVVNSGITPSSIVDSGNGIHIYWRVSDLDPKSYLRLSRRLMRLFSTDEAVGQIFQLMRLPGTLNTKKLNDPVACEMLAETELIYTCEELDKLLPPLTPQDEAYCTQHYDKTYNIDRVDIQVDDTLPPKFGKLLRTNTAAKALWYGNTDDRSKDDYRLANIMFANDFTKEEATSVLVNSSKALARAPIHRVSYATNIIDKIWTFQAEPGKSNLAPTVREILSRGEETLVGTRFPCHQLVDDTAHGFRLGQIIGIIGGSGVGKTTLTLNMFLWFCQNNPDYHHFFFSLEQPIGEIAARIRTICGDNDKLFDRIHVVSNYAEDDTYKHLGLKAIEEQLKAFEAAEGVKVGAVVIDHIGVLDKDNKNGENDGLIGICRIMKSVAVNCNIMLIMLSQAPREKCGIGDLELDKSAAYGTVFFESFLDYAILLWQPLKRVYAQGAPTIMAIKFGKIRHKKQHLDHIKEDVCYQVYFDPNNERLRELTQDEEISAKYWVSQATNLRNQDKKTDIVSYDSRRINEVAIETPVEDNQRRVRH